MLMLNRLRRKLSGEQIGRYQTASGAAGGTSPSRLHGHNEWRRSAGRALRHDLPFRPVIAKLGTIRVAIGSILSRNSAMPPSGSSAGET
jgi:hypothetical protein